MKIKDKGQKPVVVVTGGNRGIGLNITEAFVNAGYYVVIGARNDYSLHKKFGNKVFFESIDVRHEESHQKLVKLASKMQKATSKLLPIKNLESPLLKEKLFLQSDQ